MARVYLAVQQSLSRYVALKIRSRTEDLDDEHLARFLNEGRLIAQLSHPNIITVHDIGAASGTHYLSMTYLSGGTLCDKIRAGLEAQRAVEILRCLADALGYAHARGIVHRDIKPGNVLFAEDGTPVLSDFGIAKSVGDEDNAEQEGQMIGSLRYMSPEQIVGREVDHRSDLFSLGVMFWQMLTQSLPHDANDPVGLAMTYANEAVPALPQRLARFQPVVDRLLARAPEERFQSADGLLVALDNMARDESAVTIIGHPQLPMGSAHAPETVNNERQGRATGSRMRALLLSVAAVALIAIAGTVYSLLERPDGAPSLATSEDQPPSETSPDETETPQAWTERLLAEAQALLAAGQITTPPGENAFERFSRVLELQPHNTDAKRGLLAIGRLAAADKAYRSARALADRGKTADALRMVETGLRVDPENDRLNALRLELPERR